MQFKSDIQRFASVIALSLLFNLTACQMVSHQSQKTSVVAATTATTPTTGAPATAKSAPAAPQSAKSISCPENGDSVRVPKPLRGGFYRPLIVGHRGAPGYVPEETERSYRLALQLGADYIEPDLVMSKDGVLIVRHENDLSDTTNADEVYPNLIAEKVVDGVKEKGVFSEDLTLAQIKKLKAKERLPYRSHKDDGKYDVLTFEEYLQIAKDEGEKRGRPIGLIPEIKHSTYFHKLGFDPERQLVRLLNKYGYNKYKSPVIIQSMEISNLKRLRGMVRVELMQLLDEPNLQPADVVAAHGKLTYKEMATPKGLRRIARYADWISPDKSYIIPLNENSKTMPKPTSFVHDAHVAGLNVMPWTFRADDVDVRKFYSGDEDAEYNQFFSLGIDGLFTDFPDLAAKFRERYLAKCNGVSEANLAK